MIKKTLYFGNPASLFAQDNQLKIEYPESKTTGNADYIQRSNKNSVPIEDIGVVILDDPYITIAISLLSLLLENNCAVITTNSKHMPAGMFFPLESHTQQSERFRQQIDASEPLKKQLWQQTVKSKIVNQATVLAEQGIKTDNMKKWAADVRSGDPGNLEGRASVYYWKNLFRQYPDFIRERFGDPPNNLLNYGYAILRSVVARALAGSGLLPTLGIHHTNKYNAFCLADDIMEPFRPFVDRLVLDILEDEDQIDELTPAIKKKLLAVPVLPILIEGKRSPLMVGVQRTTASLAGCFTGEIRKILYPEIMINAE